MRTLFFVLILINLLFFIWSKGIMGEVDTGLEPERLGQQINPELLKAQPLDPITSNAFRSDCRHIAGLNLRQAEQLYGELESAGLWVNQLPQEASENWVVELPALGSRNLAQAKATELGKLGVSNYILVDRKGNGKVMVFELGRYGSKEQAQQSLDGLNRKGIWSALVVNHPQEPMAKLEVRAPTELLLDRLPILLNGVGGARMESCS